MVEKEEEEQEKEWWMRKEEVKQEEDSEGKEVEGEEAEKVKGGVEGAEVAREAKLTFEEISNDQLNKKSTL